VLPVKPQSKKLNWSTTSCYKSLAPVAEEITKLPLVPQPTVSSTGPQSALKAAAVKVSANPYRKITGNVVLTPVLVFVLPEVLKLLKVV